MSDYGPPTNDQIRAFHNSVNRTAAWVSSQAGSSPPRPASANAYRPSRSSSRGSSLPPPPPGFKYASPDTPVVYKTQAATYTVVPGGAKQVVVDASHHSSSRARQRSTSFSAPSSAASPHRSPSSGSKSHHAHSHSHSHSHSYKPVAYQVTTAPGYQTTYVIPANYQQVHIQSSHPKPKEQPLIRRLFGFGGGGTNNSDSNKSTSSSGRTRRHSTSSGGSKIAIKW